MLINYYQPDAALKPSNATAYLRYMIADRHLSHPDFTDFYNRYWKLLYTTAFAKTGDHADSVDIVQDLFIHLWENKDRLHVRESVEGYLLTSLRNRILNHFRNTGVREKGREDYARFIDTLVSNQTALIEQELVRNMAEEVVQKALDQLPEKMKYIVVQNKYHQKSIQQLSEELDIAPQTVKNQLTKALQRMELLLRQHHAQEISFLFVALSINLSTPF